MYDEIIETLQFNVWSHSWEHPCCTSIYNLVLLTGRYIGLEAKQSKPKQSQSQQTRQVPVHLPAQKVYWIFRDTGEIFIHQITLLLLSYVSNIKETLGVCFPHALCVWLLHTWRDNIPLPSIAANVHNREGSRYSVWFHLELVFIFINSVSNTMYKKTTKHGDSFKGGSSIAVTVSCLK